jgi:HAD superfamily hydrolase (TIGR01458 family)
MPTNFKGILFDIDGVLVYQGKVYPGAVETIAALRQRGVVLRFLTNSTLKSRKSAASKLRRVGFQVFDEEVITASYATACYLAEQKPHSCWVMVEGAGLDEFSHFVQDAENPEYVVIGDNRSRFDFDHLNHALRLILKGAKLVGMQAEAIDSSMGEVELNVGSWVGMLERAAGVQATYIGKPNPYAFSLAMQGMGLQKSEVLMVGDRLSTDVAGARQFGLRSALVKTGEYSSGDLDGELQPDFVLDSISDLLDRVLK